MFKKVKGKLGNCKKKLATLVTASALTVGSAVSAFAGEASTTGTTMAATLKTAMDSMVTDFMGFVAVVLPIGLTVFGSVWGIKKAKRFFSSMAN